MKKIHSYLSLNGNSRESNENKPADDFLSKMAAPARRALQQKGITPVEALAVFTETEIAALHGMGPGSLIKLRNILISNHLTFKQ